MAEQVENRVGEIREVKFLDLGKIDYREAWEIQSGFLKEVVDIKVKNRQLAKESHLVQKHYLIFCEHPPVFTLGRSGEEGHLLLNEQELKTKGAEFYKINRGGDITYHGPGQIVGYPIFDLDHFFTDVHRYVRFLEEAAIRTLSEYGIDGYRVKGMSGVWVKNPKSHLEEKVCAVGVHLSRWVTMHGFALNVNTDLSFFNYIVPCGIPDKPVTSMQQLLGTSLPMEEVKSRLLFHFSELFGFKVIMKEQV